MATKTPKAPSPKKERRALTTEEQAAARRLKAIWEKEVKSRSGGMTQMEAASRCEITQSAFGQYLNGLVPLNMPILVKFAAELGIAPARVYPEIAAEIQKAAALDSGLSPEAMNVARIYDTASKKHREAFDNLAELITAAPLGAPDEAAPKENNNAQSRGRNPATRERAEP